MNDLSLPRHQWRFHQVRHNGRPIFGLWCCPDCLATCKQEQNMPPAAGLCPGPGPHDPESIANLKRIWTRYGWKVPERLREG